MDRISLFKTVRELFKVWKSTCVLQLKLINVVFTLDGAKMLLLDLFCVYLNGSAWRWKGWQVEFGDQSLTVCQHGGYSLVPYHFIVLILVYELEKINQTRHCVNILQLLQAVLIFGTFVPFA
jgi:hypothetical protein